MLCFKTESFNKKIVGMVAGDAQKSSFRIRGLNIKDKRQEVA